MKALLASEKDAFRERYQLGDEEPQNQATSGTLTESVQRLAEKEIKRRPQIGHFLSPSVQTTTNNSKVKSKNTVVILAGANGAILK